MSKEAKKWMWSNGEYDIYSLEEHDEGGFVGIDEEYLGEMLQAYADEGKKGFKYCPYCGSKLQHKIETDANSPLECKSQLCNFTLKQLEK